MLLDICIAEAGYLEMLTVAPMLQPRTAAICAAAVLCYENAAHGLGLLPARCCYHIATCCVTESAAAITPLS
jgi:hypothetical protein